MTNTAQQRINILKWLSIGLLALIIAAVVSVYLLQPPQASTDSPSRAAYSNLGGDFQLNGHSGPVALSDYQDKVVVMMFGFTSCPDVCPTGMATVAAAIKQLPEALQSQVQPVFISLDPERDSVGKLAEYTQYFHPGFVGLTGETSTLDKVVKNYGGFYQKVPLPDSELGYTVDHSTRVYLINRQGQLAKMLFHNSPPAEISREIQALLTL